jgi:predicted DNA-binding protein with PD1-like motif
MMGTRRTRSVGVLCGALAGLALPAAHAQQAPPPLPDGYMRAPAVPVGLAPKVRVTESQATAHVFDLNFSPGDEIMSGLTDLVLEHDITSGYITGLGGLSGALLAWGDPEVGAFKMIPVDEKCELISLLGHVAVRDGKPYVHLHAVVGFRDGSTKAGHVMEARVAPLAEISLVATSIGGAQ